MFRTPDDAMSHDFLHIYMELDLDYASSIRGGMIRLVGFKF